MVVFETVMLAILGLVFTGGFGFQLLRLHRLRKVSDVTGTVVDRDRRRGDWATYPVVEFTTRDGRRIRRTFHQLARPTLGRAVRIVYDPDAPEGRRRVTSMTESVSGEPMIYSVQLLLLWWLGVAVGLVAFVVCIGVAVASG
jgi:hypothetical protein